VDLADLPALIEAHGGDFNAGELYAKVVALIDAGKAERSELIYGRICLGQLFSFESGDELSSLDVRQIVLALAGSNGAGKSTFFHTHLADGELRFVNADDLAAEMSLGAYEAADLAASILEDACRRGMNVVMIFIRIDSSDTSKQRVSMRAMQGGHDVPDEKLESRFDRTSANLELALPIVIVFDNTDLARPYRLEAVYRAGKRIGP